MAQRCAIGMIMLNPSMYSMNQTQSIVVSASSRTHFLRLVQWAILCVSFLTAMVQLRPIGMIMWNVLNVSIDRIQFNPFYLKIILNVYCFVQSGGTLCVFSDRKDSSPCGRGVHVERFDLLNQLKTMCCCCNYTPNAFFDVYRPCVLCVSFLTAKARCRCIRVIIWTVFICLN